MSLSGSPVARLALARAVGVLAAVSVVSLVPTSGTDQRMVEEY